MVIYYLSNVLFFFCQLHSPSKLIKSFVIPIYQIFNCFVHFYEWLILRVFQTEFNFLKFEFKLSLFAVSMLKRKNRKSLLKLLKSQWS